MHRLEVTEWDFGWKAGVPGKSLGFINQDGERQRLGPRRNCVTGRAGLDIPWSCPGGI